MIKRLFNPSLARLAASLLPPPVISLLTTFPPSPRRGASHIRQRSASDLAPSHSSCTLPPLPNSIFSTSPSNTLESTTLDRIGIKSHFCSWPDLGKCDKTMFVQNLLSFSESHQIFYQMYRFHNVMD